MWGWEGWAGIGKCGPVVAAVGREGGMDDGVRACGVHKGAQVWVGVGTCAQVWAGVCKRWHVAAGVAGVVRCDEGRARVSGVEQGWGGGCRCE